MGWDIFQCSLESEVELLISYIYIYTNTHKNQQTYKSTTSLTSHFLVTRYPFVDFTQFNFPTHSPSQLKFPSLPSTSKPPSPRYAAQPRHTPIPSASPLYPYPYPTGIITSKFKSAKSTPVQSTSRDLRALASALLFFSFLLASLLTSEKEKEGKNSCACSLLTAHCSWFI